MDESKADGSLVGPFRTPQNALQAQEGSIHNDEVAGELGFKGGTVSGRIHLDQFVPLILRAYGDTWFEAGGLSIHFNQATVDGEEVQARLTPGGSRSLLHMYNRAGELICQGSAAQQANDDNSEVEVRLRRQAVAQAGELRILAELSDGDECEGVPLLIEIDDLQDALRRVTEDVPLYSTRGVLPPSEVVKLAKIAETELLSPAGSAVGLWGALEVRNLKGPLYAGRKYVGRGRVEKLTQSPKTETAWCKVAVTDEATNEEAALVTFMSRYIKASSVLWQ